MTDAAMTSKRIEEVPFAGIRKAVDKANAMEAKGVRVIHFDIGRPDFDTPAHIKEAAKKALDQGIVHYAPNVGMPALREALADAVAKQKSVMIPKKRS